MAIRRINHLIIQTIRRRKHHTTNSPTTDLHKVTRTSLLRLTVEVMEATVETITTRVTVATHPQARHIRNRRLLLGAAVATTAIFLGHQLPAVVEDALQLTNIAAFLPLLLA